MDRREFLAFLAGTTAATRFGCPGPQESRVIGIQLYTVRRLMTADAERTLKALADIGYREVELAGLYGKTPAEFRKLLDGSDLNAPATHIGINELRNGFSKVLDDSAILGHKWIIVPSLPAADQTVDGYKRVADLLNETGAKARPLGFRTGFHNHSAEFKVIDGQRGFDLLLANTDPALVDFELDLFWIRSGGADALDYFKRYPGRFRAVHVKDMAADGKQVNVGEGVIDFAGIFPEADRVGVRHYFVEHDQPADPLNDVRKSFLATRKLLNG